MSQLDNERLAIAIVSLAGLVFLVPLLLVEPEFLEEAWFLSLFNIPAVYGSFIAIGAYIGRLCNLISAQPEDKKTKVSTLLNKKVIIRRHIGKQEKELTPLGMLLGMSLAIACIALHMLVPFLNVFSYFAYLLFIMGYMCTLGGLFNRLGSSMDETRLIQEKRAILFGAIFGFFLAISCIFILVSSGTLPFIAIAGVSKIFFDLFVLHKTLFTFTFIFCLSSLSASFFDYFAKAACFLKYKYLGSNDTTLNERIASRYHEYRGAFLGLGTGCLLCAGIIVGLALTGGLIAPPLTLGISLLLTLLTCNSRITPALFSRVGRVIDGLKRTLATEEKNTDENFPQAILQNQERSNSKMPEIQSSSLIPILKLTEQSSQSQSLKTSFTHTGDQTNYSKSGPPFFLMKDGSLSDPSSFMDNNLMNRPK